MGRKHSVSEIWPVYVILHKKKVLSKNSTKNATWKQSLLCLQRIEHNLYWKMKFLKQATQICFRKICPDQHNDPLRFLSADDSFKIKKGLELVPRPHFSYNFSINLPSFITRLYFLTKLFSKMCFLFHV